MLWYRGALEAAERLMVRWYSVEWEQVGRQRRGSAVGGFQWNGSRWGMKRSERIPNSRNAGKGDTTRGREETAMEET